MSKKLKKASICIFYKGMEETYKRIFGSLFAIKNVYCCEGGSICSSPPNMGFTGKFCVYVRQNVTKPQDFSRIFDIWTFCQHFVNMLTTCTTKQSRT